MFINWIYKCFLTQKAKFANCSYYYSSVKYSHFRRLIVDNVRMRISWLCLIIKTILPMQRLN